MKVDLNYYMPTFKLLFWRHENRGEYPFYIVEGERLSEGQRETIGEHPWITPAGGLKYEAHLTDYREKEIWLDAWQNLIPEFRFLNLTVKVIYVTEWEAEQKLQYELKPEIIYTIKNGEVDVQDTQNQAMDEDCLLSDDDEAAIDDYEDSMVLPWRPHMNIAMYYVDGDNNPGTRTGGLENMGFGDIVKVFYNNQNTYYRDSANRKKMEDIAECRLDFVEVECGNDAADFAICVDAANVLTETFTRPPLVCLISADKHFCSMKKQLEARFPNANIVTAKTIEEAYMEASCLALNSLGKLRTFLEKKYGRRNGDKVFRDIETLFAEQSVKRPERKPVSYWMD